MTPDELKKEAERIVVAITDEMPVLTSNRKRLLTKEIESILRAVREAGFNEAKEKAARLLEERDCECEESNCCSGYNYIEKIRALDSGYLL